MRCAFFNALCSCREPFCVRITSEIIYLSSAITARMAAGSPHRHSYQIWLFDHAIFPHSFLHSQTAASFLSFAVSPIVRGVLRTVLRTVLTVILRTVLAVSALVLCLVVSLRPTVFLHLRSLRVSARWRRDLSWDFASFRSSDSFRHALRAR